MFRMTPILLCLALAGCGGGTDSDLATTNGPGPDAGATYTLSMRVGQQIVISEEALTVTFAEVTDSRCPTQVQCIWAGQGKVTLVVSQLGYPTESLAIGTPASPSALSNESSYQAFRLTLESLDPNPTIPGPVQIELYRATVLVEKR